jgi:VanZ family protein
VIYWIILFILTSLPSRALPSLGTSDKIKHFGAYFILTVLIRLAVHFRFKLKQVVKKEMLLTILVVFAYSFLDELHQLLIPGRYFDWMDLLANKTGMIAGLIMSVYFITFAQKNE